MEEKIRRSVRNPIGWRERLARLQGTPVHFDLSTYDGQLREIDAHGPTFAGYSDDTLTDRARQLCRRAIQESVRLESFRAEFFALAREAAHRALGLRPFDEQILGALALDDGRIVDMQTGEGKTLAAVLPAALEALAGKGVHVLTVNDYLARRDAEWMKPVYNLLGLSVAFVQHDTPAAERREAYAADITYVTAKEAGFDHLRDLLATDPLALVHRRFHVAIVDEADSLLIDEARVPLVIAGSIDREESPTRQMAALVASLTPGVHFDLDEYKRNVELTDAGVRFVERQLGIGNLHGAEHLARLTELNCALHARALLSRDVDYIVRDGRIGVVDEFTGRVVADRHWPDGLQAALEAKEGLERQGDGRILNSITTQHFLQGYEWICGMTGTAQTAARELYQMYGLEVVVVPTHRPMIRVDHPDVVFARRDVKERAVVAAVVGAHAGGRPVLVGTLTVEESERLAQRLRETGVACHVLNARNDFEEARIVAAAGAPGAVTISTHMAGRGTDIRLGDGTPESHARVAALGGLYVIGTNRHESLRVDLQLRGRAGRQGDPGESRFFVSLEDDLLVRYGIAGLLGERVSKLSREEPIDDPAVTNEVARAQRIIEGQNYEIRKTLWRYASVIERHRQDIMGFRQGILTGEIHPGLWGDDQVRHGALVAQVGEAAVDDAERRVLLATIDRVWRNHLALAADLREGIHLVALGGQDPLSRFTTELELANQRLRLAVREEGATALEAVRVHDRRLDLDALDLKGPSSTWTYLVNDDPFKNQIGMMLTGGGRTTIAIYAAATMGPLLLLWGLVERLWRKRPPRRI